MNKSLKIFFILSVFIGLSYLAYIEIFPNNTSILHTNTNNILNNNKKSIEEITLDIELEKEKLKSNKLLIKKLSLK